MGKRKLKANWMGANVVLFSASDKFADKPIKAFKAGSKGMCENMARWAAKNNSEIINLKRDPRSGTLKVYL